jgi:RND family efflux transporter MFP subunit
MHLSRDVNEQTRQAAGNPMPAPNSLSGPMIFLLALSCKSIYNLLNYRQTHLIKHKGEKHGDLQRMKKLFIIGLAVVGIGFLGWRIYEKASDTKEGFGSRRGSPAVAVEIAPILKTAIKDVGQFTGSLSPQSEFIVAPKIAGRLEKILLDIGDVVTADQLVAVLDDEEYQQQVYQAVAELEVARASLVEVKITSETAKREYERTVALREKKIASESQLDAADSEYKSQQAKLQVASAQVSQKQAALNMAKVRLSYTRIRVPPNHASRQRVVGERFVDEGSMLAPNTPIVSILDIGTLIGIINVIERDYPKIRLGLPASIRTDAFPGQTFSGKVVRIAPLLMEKAREARVEIEIPNEQMLLKPGMFVRVQIEFAQHENATVVPQAALVKRNGDQGIFVVDRQEKKARFVPVTVGIVNETRAEIIKPELTGAVVTLGQHLLEDGANIILPNETSKADSQGQAGETGSQPGKKPVAGETT